jgi:hypothetical protein
VARFHGWVFFVVSIFLWASAQPLSAAPFRRANSLTVTAQAMGCSVATAQAVKGLDLSCSLSWLLMRLCAVSNAKPSALLEERATLSWGEVCALHGQTWAGLVRDVQARQKAFGLVIEAGTARQYQRSGSNHPDALPPSRPRP